MGLNFRKSITLFKGVKLNLSKSGASISVGTKGIHQSISTSGRATTSLGLPGTGIYYTKSANVKKIGSKLLGKDKDKDSKETKAKTSKAKEESSAENTELVEEYNSHIEAITSIHKMSDGKIDWETLKAGNVPSDVVKGSEEYKKWQDLQKFAEGILAGDIDSYFAVIDEAKPFDDLLDFGSEFEVGTDTPGKLEVEFKVKSADVVPTDSYSLTSTGKLSQKALSKSAYNELVQDYICSAILRVARDSFALLPIDTVVIHAVDKGLNSSTGFDEEITLVSAKITRDQISSVNMERVDPSDAVQSFGCNMKFAKTTGFKQVSRLTF